MYFQTQSHCCVNQIKNFPQYSVAKGLTLQYALRDAFNKIVTFVTLCLNPPPNVMKNTMYFFTRYINIGAHLQKKIPPNNKKGQNTSKNFMNC